jgi:prephenate dehydrogenase
MLLEQCSLKEWVYKSKDIEDLDIRSMHILFRPSSTPNLADRKVGLFRGQLNDEMVEMIADITQSEVVWYEDAKEHDEEMAIQQALVHRMLLLLGDALKDCNGSTYVSKRVIELSDRIKKGDVDLYERIQKNHHLPDHQMRFERELRHFNIRKYYEQG